jgi:CRP-like cAMP-binding protein
MSDIYNPPLVDLEVCLLTLQIQYSMLKSKCLLPQQHEHKQLQDHGRVGIIEQHLAVLLHTSLFDSILAEEISAILKCLKAKKIHYPKNAFISVCGDKIDSLGIILSGSVQVIKDDAAGRQTILSVFGPGETFAETLVCAGVEKSDVNVLAVTEADVLFLNYSQVVHSCTNACAFHSKLIQNMLKILSQKNILMNKKISYLVIKGMRQKLATYICEQYMSTGNPEIKIPFTRDGLADFLNVDRSAMSRELCRMRDDGLIEFHKNRFRLLDAGRLVMAT